MKKGMCVTLEDGNNYALIDSVSYEDKKYFAAVLNDDDTSNELFFFKLVSEDEEEYLEPVSVATDEVIVNALINHMAEKYKELESQKQD